MSATTGEKLKNKLLSLYDNVEYAKGVMTNAKQENWKTLLEILEEEKDLTSDRVALIALALGEPKTT